MVGRRKILLPDRFPKIVCLCGSTRFMDTFHAVGRQATLNGYIVLTICVCRYDGGEDFGKDVANQLDELQRRKIDIADEIWIIKVDGYIGEGTQGEIEYAESHGKSILYIEIKEAAEAAVI